MTVDSESRPSPVVKLAFAGWLAVLGLGVHYGRGLAPWLEQERPGLAMAGLLALGGLGLAWALRAAAQRGLPRAALARVALAGLGMALLGWAQPLMIERLHLALYGVLGLLCWGLWPGRGGWERLWRAAALAALVGGLDELAQAFHPQRVGDWRDVATNAAAAALVIGTAAAVSGGRRTKP